MAVDQIKRLYESMPAKLDRARKRFGRALTLSEKILVAHADDFDKQEWSRGKAQLRLRVDRVSLQDATGQMALLQFMQAGKKQAAVPSTVHSPPPSPARSTTAGAQSPRDEASAMPSTSSARIRTLSTTSSGSASNESEAVNAASRSASVMGPMVP